MKPLYPFFLVAALGLAGCSLADPPPTEYVLGRTPPATTAAVSETGLPVLEVARVRLPDYLDTTDIVERRGNELVPSPRGRWGERLSLGLTRALTASLAARLPGMVVTATLPVDRPERQVFVDVASFEPRPERGVVLVARWSVAERDSRRILFAEQTSLVEPVARADDGAVAAAMSLAADRLADRIAAAIQSRH